MKRVCKNIYCWGCFIFSSAFCGRIIVHIPYVEYTPGFWFKVQKKKISAMTCVDLRGTPMKERVGVRVCTFNLRWHLTIKIHTCELWITEYSQQAQAKKQLSRFSWLSTNKAKQRFKEKYQQIWSWQKYTDIKTPKYWTQPPSSYPRNVRLLRWKSIFGRQKHDVHKWRLHASILFLLHINSIYKFQVTPDLVLLHPSQAGWCTYGSPVWGTRRILSAVT